MSQCDSLVCWVDILKEVAIHSGCHDATADHASKIMYAQRNCRENLHGDHYTLTVHI